MTIEFWNFSKKKNSTKQPSAGSGTQFTGVELKNDTSILNPVILIRTASLPVPTVAPSTVFTYAYIAKFTRYYFVTDWVYVAGIWECHLSIDVLASHKVMIGATSAYIERSASAYNGDIIDGIYPATTDYDIRHFEMATTYRNNYSSSLSCFILGVINQEANTIGAVTYYAIDLTNLNTVLAYLFSGNIYTASNITEVSEGLFKSMFNPFQYIVSCLWMPFPLRYFGNVQNAVAVKVGYYTIPGALGVLMENIRVADYVTLGTGVTIPEHPQASTRGSFLNYAPYTKLTLYIQPFGAIPIDTSFFRKGRLLKAGYEVDSITGQACLRISLTTANGSDEDNVCAERTAVLGVPIQLAQVYSDYSSSLNTLASGLTSGSVLGAISGAIGATVQSALASAFPSVSSSGSNGSFLSAFQKLVGVIEFTKIVDGDNTDLGRPLMEVRTINTLSGYIKCGEAHFEGPCFESEKDKIMAYMLDGFYYE